MNTYLNYSNDILLPANTTTAFVYGFSNLKIGSNRSLVFKRMESKMWQSNLQIIDSYLPQIIAYAVVYNLDKKACSWKKIVRHLIEMNPIGYNLATGHRIYEAKLKSFLAAIALGMNAKNVWQNVPEFIIGINRVSKLKGHRINYVYNKSAFENYLFDNTTLMIKQLSEDESRVVHLIPQINFI
jgi:hypothetical protein